MTIVWQMSVFPENSESKDRFLKQIKPSEKIADCQTGQKGLIKNLVKII